VALNDTRALTPIIEYLRNSKFFKCIRKIQYNILEIITFAKLIILITHLIYIYIYIYIHNIHTRTHARAHTHICIYTYLRTHTHTHTYIYIHIYTYNIHKEETKNKTIRRKNRYKYN
jgi:uncharacterized membrane protein